MKMANAFGVLLISLYSVSFSVLSVAAIEDHRSATWNMQGSSASSESKWRVNVRQLMTGLDVLAIQEAGSPPESAQPTSRVIPSPAGTSIPIHELTWNIGTSTRPEIYYIYFVEWDLGAGRVNPAIVTRTRADHIVAIANPISSTGDPNRPVIGVGFNRLNNVGADYYFTLHAFATGGGDAALFIDAIYQYFSGDPDSQWLVMGDYNQSPTVLDGRLRNRLSASAYQNVSIITQSSPTQASGNTLDYAVVGQYGSTASGIALVAAMFVARLAGQLVSDHTPVKFYKK
ncbi:cytolethal distending toxin subunit B family protein [Pseudomonas aeruginosa]|uniref:cytolethal distending toxin subunit B family protein n=1 Tax=Pseudomonas aeruginosa TaxID=287 RepID=UPI0018C8CEE6|nr:cytolethal distending toxin subunit B family protein [Pseudomonas aeruginosa]